MKFCEAWNSRQPRSRRRQLWTREREREGERGSLRGRKRDPRAGRARGRERAPRGRDEVEREGTTARGLKTRGRPAKTDGYAGSSEGPGRGAHAYGGRGCPAERPEAADRGGLFSRVVRRTTIGFRPSFRISAQNDYLRRGRATKCFSSRHPGWRSTADRERARGPGFDS